MFTKVSMVTRRVATCKPGKPGLASFSKTQSIFLIQFLSFRKMKVRDRQNGPSGLPEKNWLATRLVTSINNSSTKLPQNCHFNMHVSKEIPVLNKSQPVYFVILKSSLTRDFKYIPPDEYASRSSSMSSDAQ